MSLGLIKKEFGKEMENDVQPKPIHIVTGKRQEELIGLLCNRQRYPYSAIKLEKL